MKVLGIFKCMPMESMTLDFITSLTNTPKKEVEVIIKQLIKDGHVKGKRRFRLAGKHKETYLKHHR